MPQTTSLDRRFLFKVILPMLGLIAVLLASAMVGLLVLADKQNAMSLALQERTAGNAVRHFAERLGEIVSGYAGRDETAEHVIARFDSDWLDSHLGPDRSEALLVVLDPGDRPLFSRLGGRRVPAEAMDVLPLSFRQLVSRARAGRLSDVVTQMLAIDGQPCLMAVTGVRAVADGGRPADRGYLMALAFRIDRDSLADLSDIFMLPDLRYEPDYGAVSDGAARIRLTGEDGSMADSLVWDPLRPGNDLIRAVAPGLLLMFVAYLLLTVAVLAIVRRAAHLISVSEERALHDALTGLPNRLLLLDRMQRLLDALGGDDMAVFYLDLDGFKDVNDRDGHAAGDAVLIGVARRLRQLCREGDMVARLGGDEFVVVIPTADRRVAEARAETILSAVSSPYLHGGRRLVVGVSIGIAMAPEDGLDVTTLLHRADEALYVAKEAGKGAIRFHDRGMARPPSGAPQG